MENSHHVFHLSIKADQKSFKLCFLNAVSQSVSLQSVQSDPRFGPPYGILNNDSSHKFIRSSVYLIYLIDVIT